MKILILGSEGFIGKHLVEFYLTTSHQVVGCDLYEQPSKNYEYHKISRLSPELDLLFGKQNIDICINAAGSGNVSYSMTHPLIDFEANSLDVIKVLESIRLNAPNCKYLHISSAAVYGSPSKLPIAETDVNHPLSPYGWHKLIAENICIEYHQIYNIKTAIVRPFSVFGPGLKKQLFWDLHQKYKTQPKPIEIWGTGQESRDFIYISDVVNSFNLIINKSNFNGDIYNVASGKEFYIADICKLYFALLDKNTSFIFNQKTREGDPINWRANIDKIKEIGFIPKINIEDGLKNYIEWIKRENI